MLKNDRVCYTLRKSKRAKHIRLSVGCDAKICVTIPWKTDEILASNFIYKKSDWLIKKINYFKNKEKTPVPKPNRRDYLKYKKLASQIVEGKIARFNAFYGFSFRKICIRNQKTRWGSCSRDGNLSFNYRVIFLPETLSDYVIVHELCHLSQLNHSENFWMLVEKTVPDFRKIRKKVRIM